MRFISTQAHGIMDYLAGILLIASPWIFNFYAEGAESAVPIIVGAGMLLISLMTAYECGVVGMINMKTHLAIDFAAGVLLAASPWIFGFADFVWIPHVVFGVLEIGAALMTKTVPTNVPRHSEPQTM